MVRTTLSAGEEALLRRFKETVQLLEPEAHVVLYGSRARGDARPESDWDLLILLKGPLNRERERRLRHALFDVELETDSVMNVLTHSLEDWQSDQFRAMPFFTYVTQEGLEL